MTTRRNRTPACGQSNSYWFLSLKINQRNARTNDGAGRTIAVTELPPAAHDNKILETRAMANIVLFPLQRRQKLLRQLRRAQTDNEVRYALRRTVTALQRLGIAPELIDAQIRAVSLMTRREAWYYRPEGAA